MPFDSTCMDAISKAIGRPLSDKESNDIYDAIITERNLLRLENSVDSFDKITRDAGKKTAEQIKIDANIKRAQKALNSLKEYRQAQKVIAGHKNYELTGLIALMDGDPHYAPGIMRSAGSDIHYIADTAMQKIKYGASTATDNFGEGWAIYQQHSIGSIDEQLKIANAMVPSGAGRNDAPPTSVFQKIGKAITDQQNELFELFRLEGAFGAKREDWLAVTWHNQLQILRMTQDGWVKFIHPLLDKKTFAHLKEGETEVGYLKKVWEGFSSGVHITGDGNVIAKGTSDVTTQAGRPRSLIFKDNRSWLTYNQKAGAGTLHDAIQRTVQRRARMIALARHFGTNPEQGFKNIVDSVIRQSSPKSRREIQQSLNGSGAINLRDLWSEISNKNAVSVDGMLGIVASSAKAITNWQTLGNSVVSMIPDPFIGGAALKRLGVKDSILSGAYRQFKSGWFQRLNSQEQVEVATLVGAYLDADRGFRLGIGNKLDMPDDLEPGIISRGSHLFYGLNGMRHTQDGMRVAARAQLSAAMALKKNTAWNKLPEDYRRGLEMHGIDGRIWDAVTKHIETRNPTGDYDLMVFDSIKKMPDEVFAPLLDGAKPTPRRIAQTKNEVIARYMTYLSDRGREIALEPGFTARSIVTRSERPGTPAAVILSLVSQLKQFSIRILEGPLRAQMYYRGARTATEVFTGTPLGPIVGGGGLSERAGRFGFGSGPNNELRGIAAQIAYLTFAGYIAMSIKDMMKGREPRDPSDPKTMMAAMLQSGALGIFGDFFFGELRTRFSGGLVQTLAGPTLGKLDDLMDLWGRAKEGDPLAGATVNFMIQQIPDLLGTKLLLNYMFIWNLQEHFTPGTLARREDTIRRELGQEMWLPPTSVLAQ